MNSVLIVSDSHGLTTELKEIQNRHQTDLKIHCGDSELSEKATSLAGYTTVKGNCDWQGNFPPEEVIDVGGLRFYITHGHAYHVKTTMLSLQYRAQEVEADVVCFGHSHIAFAEKIAEQLFINPGSIRSPRQFNTPSYALLTWENPKEIIVQFYHVTGEEITNFPYPNTFFIK